jgi:ELWxxDGT repeat protein
MKSLRLFFAIFIFLTCPFDFLMGQTMLKDIVTHTKDTYFKNIGTNTKTSISLDNAVLFAASNDNGLGFELWKTDGTADGTQFFKDILLGEFSSIPHDFIKTNNKAIFVAKSEENVPQSLFVSDGTIDGTFTLLDPFEYYVDKINVYDSSFAYLLVGSLNGTFIYKTDGTLQGTQEFLQLDATKGLVGNPVILNNSLYYILRTSDYKYELWKSDGTINGAIMLKSTDSFFELNEIRATDNLVYFWSYKSQDEGYELWKSDGTILGTKLVKDIEPNQYGGYSLITESWENYLFFAKNSGTGDRLWRTDGTITGTVLIDNIQDSYQKLLLFNGKLLAFCSSGLFNVPFNGPNELLAASFFNNQLIVNDKIYFNSNYIEKPWVSDGTISGTHVITEITPSLDSFEIYPLGNIGGKVIWVGKNQKYGRELWISEPNGNAISFFKDLNINTHDSYPSSFAKQGDIVAFGAYTDNNGREIYTYNKNDNEVKMIDHFPGLNGSNPQYFVTANGFNYFVASDSLHGSEFWQWTTDPSNATLVQDLAPNNDPSAYFGGLIVANDKILFNSINQQYQNALFALTPGQPSNIINLNDANVNAPASYLTNFSGKTYFTYSGRILSVTDGINVSNVFNFGNSKSIAGMIVFKNKLFISIVGDGIPNELWVSDGTASGTTLFNGTAFGIGNEPPSYMTVVGDNLYFEAINPQYIPFIFKTNGLNGVVEQINTFPNQTNYAYLYGLTACNGVLVYAVAIQLGFTSMLFRTDGTVNGSYILRLFDGDIALSSKAVVGNKLYFNGDSNDFGSELWETDGTFDGTVQVADICPGECSSDPHDITLIDNSLYFYAFHTEFGIEPWRFDVQTNLANEPKESSKFDFNIVENPISSHLLKLQIETNEVEDFDINIFNTLGQLVLESKYSSNIGINDLNIPFVVGNQGLFYVNIKNKDKQVSKSFIANP